ncbi:MAG: hypothetical protein IKD77_01705 [Bacilli bacterium]|nr:hypothetical protein [Bacilli bacterium]
MAKVVTITDGQGTSNLINGNFTVSASVNGYDNTSIVPSSVSITEGTNTYNFTISANGTLTLHVTDDGTSTGTPIVGATFIRTDSSGNEYGTSITSDVNGDAVFNNVPFSATDAPLVYFKQTASDGDHEFDNTVQNTSLSTDTATVQIQNVVGASRTISLTDENYSNLPITNGSITFTN